MWLALGLYSVAVVPVWLHAVWVACCGDGVSDASVRDLCV